MYIHDVFQLPVSHWLKVKTSFFLPEPKPEQSTNELYKISNGEKLDLKMHNALLAG